MTSDRIVSIQALRFFAAAAVVYCHTLSLARGVSVGAEAFGPRFVEQVCAAGADVFFVISGFIITLTGPLASKRPTATAFFWRRWSRVVPFFYIASLPALVFMSNGLNVDQTVATLFLWPAAGSTLAFPYLGNGWTLSFEFLFYGAVSLVLIGHRTRRNLFIVISAYIGLIVLRHLLPWDGLRVLGNSLFLEFGFGVALALAWKRGALQRLNPRIGLAAIAAGCAVFALEGYIGVNGSADGPTTLDDTVSLWRVVALGLPALALVGGALICERWARGPIASFFARLGESSYSLYLVHFWTVMGLGWLLGRAAVKPVALTVVVCSLTLAIACGMLLHHLIERPVIDLLRGVRLPNWRTRPELVDAGQSAAQAVFVVGEERPGEGQSGAGTVRVA